MATENERVVSEFCQTWTTLNIDKVMEFFTLKLSCWSYRRIRKSL
jgi:hypothetical protein